MTSQQVSPIRNRAGHSRSGFTLIEILVTISIIGLLIALLIPVIGATRATAQVAQVQSELRTIEAGLTDFKSKYNRFPPSRFVLYETATGDPSWEGDTTDGFTDQDRLKSVAFIRQVWPSFDFSLDRDINRDGDTTDVFVLSGAECLVFFLGGLPDNDGGPLNGFSANPADPFEKSGSRVGPFHEFNPTRFTDIDSDGAAEYLDSIPEQTTPLLYLNSNNGTGYQASETSGRIDDHEVFGDDNVSNLGGYTRTAALPALRSNNYLQPDGTAGLNGGDESDYGAWKPKSFQLISPGFDFAYGLGGEFDPEDTDGLNAADRDNITNFHSGQLSP